MLGVLKKMIYRRPIITGRLFKKLSNSIFISVRIKTWHFWLPPTIGDTVERVQQWLHKPVQKLHPVVDLDVVEIEGGMDKEVEKTTTRSIYISMYRRL